MNPDVETNEAASLPGSSGEHFFRIGAVARLTGVSTDKLRIWERRYSLVNPTRTESGVRKYSAADVERLRLVRKLVDNGQPISTVAGLSEEDLRARVGELETAETPAMDILDPCRVAVFGKSLALRVIKARDEMQGLDVETVQTDWEHFCTACAAKDPNVLLVEFETVTPRLVMSLRDLISRVKPARTVLLYRYAVQEHLAAALAAGVIAVRSPIGFAELAIICREGRRSSVNQGKLPATDSEELATTVVPRRFDDETLTRLAMVSDKIRCECPTHLVELIMHLSAFESYSAQCETASPADIAIHTHLHARSSQARAMIEEMLHFLANHEKLYAACGIEQEA